LIQVTGQQQKVRTWETSKPELTRTHARTHTRWSMKSSVLLESGHWKCGTGKRKMAEQTNSSSQDRASSLAAGSSVGEFMSMISVSVWLYVNDNAAESTNSINRSIAFRLSFVTCVRVCTIVCICHTIIHSLTLHIMIV